MKKIWRISQNVNNDYDTYSEAIVVAETEEEAKRIHPSCEDNDRIFYDEEKKQFWNFYSNSKETYLYEDRGTWTNDLSAIKVELIGKANPNIKEKVICASFHAG